MSTGPELRSSKQTDPLSESELKTLQKQLHDRERRLRDEAQKLDREMANIFMKPSEHILDYISRVKDLRDAILL